MDSSECVYTVVLDMKKAAQQPMPLRRPGRVPIDQ
jgi:hypothetical protein